MKVYNSYKIIFYRRFFIENKKDSYVCLVFRIRNNHPTIFTYIVNSYCFLEHKKFCTALKVKMLNFINLSFSIKKNQF